MLNMHLRCSECHAVGLRPIGDPREPPDPDRHGNRRAHYRCPVCRNTAEYGFGGAAGKWLRGAEKVEYSVPL